MPFCVAQKSVPLVGLAGRLVNVNISYSSWGPYSGLIGGVASFVDRSLLVFYSSCARWSASCGGGTVFHLDVDIMSGSFTTPIGVGGCVFLCPELRGFDILDACSEVFHVEGKARDGNQGRL